MIQKEKEQRFVQLIEDSTGVINSLCRIYYREDHDFKDARQEVILQLWKSFDSFRGESSQKTWVYKVALNTLLNKQRKRGLNTIEYEMAVTSGHQAQSYCDDDILLLHQLLDSLKDPDKAIMILLLEGYKYEEIANMFHLSKTNVSTKINRIKKQLSEKFETLTYED